MFSLHAQTTQTGTTAPAKKRVTVKTGKATIVSGDADDSSPQLISTTGGHGADKADQWPNFAALQKAADEGDPGACYELGGRYLTGTKDTPQSPARAMLYFQDAANHGHRDAAFRLGKMYADGEKIPQDYAQAIKYYTLAARAGDALAQHNLGAMYASGRGVKLDYAEGLAWLIVAASHNREADDSLKKLINYLTHSNLPSFIAAGETRAGELTQELAAAAQTTAKPAVVPSSSIAPLAPISKPEPIKIEPAQMPLAPLPPMIPPPSVSGTGN